jgi:PST family polysaccharide transporter
VCGLFNAAILSLGFVIGVHWGAIGVAIAYAIGNYVVLYPWLWWAFRESPVSFGMFIKACLFPIAISVLCITASVITRSFLHEIPPLAEIGILGTVFMIAAVPLFFVTKTGETYRTFLYSVSAQFMNNRPHTA